MPWEVEYTDEFGAWWDTLTADQQERVEQAVFALAAGGPGLGRPLVETIRDTRIANLKELRVGTIRILFVFNALRTAILLLGGDKRDRWEEWYAEAIPEAERLYDVHLRELREEGLWPDTRSSGTS